MHGVFSERSNDEHVRLREGLLGSVERLLSPTTFAASGVTGAADLICIDELKGRLADEGLAVVQLDFPLTDEQFIRIGLHLGTPQPELDPTVHAHVSSDVILNLVSIHSQTNDVALQPFAANFLTLHTESSGQSVERQPRYIILMCEEPGVDTAAQTVLVPMQTVVSRLSTNAIESLSQTRYDNAVGSPPIVRDVGGRYVFSFRDFLSQPLKWVHSGRQDGSAGVNETIRELLRAMYSVDPAYGIRWKRGLMVIIDNTFYFHGRTLAAPGSLAQSRRHLKRLRVVK